MGFVRLLVVVVSQPSSAPFCQATALPRLMGIVVALESDAAIVRTVVAVVGAGMVVVAAAFVQTAAAAGSSLARELGPAVTELIPYILT